LLIEAGASALNSSQETIVRKSANLDAVADVQDAYEAIVTMMALQTRLALPSTTASLAPGFYFHTGAWSLAVQDTITFTGKATDVWYIQVSAAVAIAGKLALDGADASNIRWVVNGAFAAAADATTFGTVLAKGAISLAAGASLEGRMYSTAGECNLGAPSVLYPAAGSTTTCPFGESVVVPPPVDDASASGDPHVINTHGHKFDIVRAGLWEMLRLPREATTTDAKVSIHAQIVDTSGGIDGCAAAPYIGEVHFNGSWLEQSTVKVSLSRGGIVVLINGEPHRASSQSVMLSDTVQMLHSEHKVEVRIGEASVQVALDGQMFHFFLNLQAWVGSRAISHCTFEFGSGRPIIKMWTVWVNVGRFVGSMLVVFLSPKAAPVGDK
jgi:hypothetical protein